MRTRSSSNLLVVSPPNLSTLNPKRRNRRRSKKPFILEESPVDTMADQRSMAELLRAPTEGYAEVIMIPPILVEQFELKYSLINMMTSEQFFRLEKDNPHDHIRWGNPPVARKRTPTFYSYLGAFVKGIEEICVTCIGAHPYYRCLAAGGNTFYKLRDNIQGYVAAVTVNYNQGSSVYRPPVIPLNELEKVKRMNEANMKSMQTQISNVKNELRNEMKNSIQASLSNQTNEIKNMMAGLFQMNTTSTSRSGSLPSNTVANPKGKVKAITTRSGIVLDGPFVPTPPPIINSNVDEHVEETLTDQDLTEKMLKALLSNKEKLQELANTPLNENCSVVILKKLPEKLKDPGKFLIPCGFNELKCKALADLGASINLMPLSVWKKLGSPELIFTRMTLELANQAICTPAGIARHVFVLVGKFTFPADFVIVDYESDPRVPLILGRPFLRTAHALTDVHGEEMILRNGDERLNLNMRHDTSSYSNQPQKESINLINVFNDSNEDFLKDLFLTNKPNGNPTFSSYPKLTSSEVKDDIFDPEGGNVLPEKLLYLDSTKDLYPPLHVNPLSGSTTSSSPNHLLEEFTDELALITFPPEYEDDLYNLADLNDNLVDSIPEMFTDKHALDYSSLPLFDEYDDDLFKVEVDALPSTKNEDKVFNPGILIQENHFEIITHVAQDKKLAISHASLMIEDLILLAMNFPSLKKFPASLGLRPEEAFVLLQIHLMSNFMASQDAKISRFGADFKQYQSEVTNRLDAFFQAFNDQIMGALPRDTESKYLVKNSIDWNRPPKERDRGIELIDPDGEKFDKAFQSIPTTRKLLPKENPRYFDKEKPESS
uniref:Reverse transcriptase domain-containing protein n=1 Tax=Tanacetum cinerariifolium TaxID=118510 RepID=A0A6L2LMI5_TANCI|nr:reverse transcriptase domain-containing protein [Tanacetum cinerariifolium]